jgi:hypothetical protein
MVQEITSSEKPETIAKPAITEAKAVLTEEKVPQNDRMKAYLERL